jgi:hypothetical protein
MAMGTQATQMATDVDTLESQHRFAWLREHCWLVAGSLLALVLAQFDKAESATMRANRERIAAMSRSERQRVEFNFGEYRRLTPEQRREIQSLHSDVEQRPELARVLAAWHQWLASLTFEDRENILQTTEPKARLALARQIIGAGAIDELRGEPLARSGLLLPNRNFHLPAVAVEFNALMTVIARHLEMPGLPQDNTLQGRLKHHASVLAELLLRVRRPNALVDAPVRAVERPRGLFPSELRRRLIEAIPDEARRRAIAGLDEAEQQRTLAQIVITGFYRELQIGLQQLRPSGDILLALYFDLPDDQRKQLEELSEDQFTRRLDELWLERQFPELAGHVHEIRRMMPSRINQRAGFLQNGNRPFLPGRRNGGPVNAPADRE